MYSLHDGSVMGQLQIIANINSKQTRFCCHQCIHANTLKVKLRELSLKSRYCSDTIQQTENHSSVGIIGHLSEWQFNWLSNCLLALVNNCYKSCWRWSVSQFSTCMRLLRHGCQRHSFWNSQTDGQMYTSPNQMNSQVVQIFMESKFQSKLRVLDKDDVKQKTSLFSVQGKTLWFLFFCFPSSVSARQFK